MKDKIEKRYQKALTLLESKNQDLTIGTEEYESFLEAIISDLKKVKSSLKTRSKSGATHRKEADRIQSAINAMKYLNNKNRRILNNSMINEEIDQEERFKRSDIKNFLKTYQ